MIVPFGSGVLFGVQVGGQQTPNPTPWRFPILQDVQVDIKSSNKKLYGQKQVPSKIRRGTIDISVKSKVAALNPNMLNQLYFACPQTTGITLIADGEVGVVGGGAPTARANTTNYAVGALYSLAGFVYKCVTAGISAGAPPALSQVIGSENEDGTAIFQCMAAVGNTVTVASAATFTADYGVRYQNGGAALINSGLVAPQQGQYQCNGGIYTFNALDIAAGVLFAYLYTNPTRGTTIALTNQFQGFAPEFKAFVYNVDNNGGYFGLQLNDCIASDIGIPSKQGDSWISTFDFEAMADATDTWGYLYADN